MAKKDLLFVIVAQDQSLFTRNFQANILHHGTDPKCRFCNTSTGTTDHPISGCTILAPNDYTNKRNRVGQYIHWKTYSHYDNETPYKWYQHEPLPAVDTRIKQCVVRVVKRFNRIDPVPKSEIIKNLFQKHVAETKLIFFTPSCILNHE